MTNTKTKEMTITAIFVAILLIQSYVPNIGYLRISPMLPAVTTIPLTMGVYGSLFGWRRGAFLGLFWGLTRLVLAYTTPGDIVSLLLFRNVFISIVPSVMSGFFAGLVADMMRNKSKKTQYLSYIFAGAFASIANTLFVLGIASIVFMKDPNMLVSHLGNYANGTPLFVILLMALGGNAIFEAIFTAILTPIITGPLKIVMWRR